MIVALSRKPRQMQIVHQVIVCYWGHTTNSKEPPQARTSAANALYGVHQVPGQTWHHAMGRTSQGVPYSFYRGDISRLKLVMFLSHPTATIWDKSHAILKQSGQYSDLGTSPIAWNETRRRHALLFPPPDKAGEIRNTYRLRLLQSHRAVLTSSILPATPTLTNISAIIDPGGGCDACKV